MGWMSSIISQEMASDGWVLTVLAILPAIVLGVYVFIKDRVEKEPLGLLLILMVFGALSCFPAGYVEGVVGDIIGSVFMPYTETEVIDGTVYNVLPSKLYYLYQGVTAFIGVALIEELGKWLVLIFLTRKNKNFNSLFDGLIYAVFVSLGFAALENVMYAFNYGLDTVLLRAITSVPGHMFFGVFMGIYYSIWKVSACAYENEKQLAQRGMIVINKPLNPNSGKWRSLFVPVLVHGFYDFCLFVEKDVWVILFCIFLLVLYVFCFARIRRFSKADHGIENYAAALVQAKYQLQSRGQILDDAEQVSAISDIIENTADQSKKS